MLVVGYGPGQARRYLIVPIFASSCRICCSESINSAKFLKCRGEPKMTTGITETLAAHTAQVRL